MPSVLVVDDDRTVRHMITAALRDSGVEVLEAENARAGLDILENRKPAVDVCLLDILLPDVSGLEACQRFTEVDPKLPVIFITSSDSSEVAIEAMKIGAYDYLTKPLNLGQVKRLVSKAIEIRRLMQVPVGVSQDDGANKGEQIVGTSPAMQEVYKSIGRVASQDVTVLIQGESGTGKELVARAIYHHSNRNERPFLAVNCAAIPAALLESELFGHEKGAFTGADRRRIGKFEQCSGGTIFLDEIGDMPSELQSKMLRLLQQQQFERVGGNETITTDVRVIAATNQDLENLVEDGKFREDLYYRLKGFLICLPPLRDRGNDIVPMAQRFLNRYSREFQRNVTSISPEALTVLKSYAWPGNVRELENVIKQAILQATGTVLMPDFLPDLDCDVLEDGSCDSGDLRPTRDDLVEFIEQRVAGGTQDLYAEAIEHLERKVLPIVLRATGGNQSQAAKILGITRGSLRNKIRTLGISIDQVVSVSDDEADEPEEAVTT